MPKNGANLGASSLSAMVDSTSSTQCGCCGVSSDVEGGVGNDRSMSPISICYRRDPNKLGQRGNMHYQLSQL